jgi:recombination protein RecA
MARKTKAASRASQIVARINAQMGEELVTLATDNRYSLQRIPTGILTLDRITGGGFARGRHIELFGDEGVGKSYCAYLTMALAQQRGEVCALIDGEHIFEEDWFEAIGGSPSELILRQPKNAEEVIKLLMLMAQKDEQFEGIGVVTIDSVTSLLPMEELKKDPSEGDDRLGSQARMMSKLLRRVTTVNRDTCFIWINQVRDDIGSYVKRNRPTGGRALGFYASSRIELRRGEKVRAERQVVEKGKVVNKPRIIGHWIQLRSEKEKTAQPYQEGMVFFDAENGRIDHETDIINLALQDGFIERHGNTYSCEDASGQLAQGTISVFKNLLTEDNDLRDYLETAIQMVTEGDDGE